MRSTPLIEAGAGPARSGQLADATVSEGVLLAVLGHSIAMQRVDYLRVGHPRDAVVTGTTRDATLGVDGGGIVARAPQCRFTVRLTGLLASVVAEGAEVSLRGQRDAVPSCRSARAS